MHLRDLALGRIDTGCTRAAYNHDDDDPLRTTTSDSNWRTVAQWHLDHILYTPTPLMQVLRWANLEDNKHSRTVGLPNDLVPTNHLQIAAAFDWRPHPQLCEESKGDLIVSMNQIESRHKLELKSKKVKIDRQWAELDKRRAREDKSESTSVESMQTREVRRRKNAVPL